MHQLYQDLISHKKSLVAKYSDSFENEYMIDALSFAREMFLDPSDCDNAFFFLPQLTRDSFSKKGLFYRTDKILMNNYTSSFKFPSASKAQETLAHATEILL